MKAELVSGGFSGCMGGNCPKVFKTDRGTFVVQGSLLRADEKAQFNVPENETVVEIPEEVLVGVATKLASK